MRQTAVVASLEPIGRGKLVLEQVRIDAVLRGLCSETRMSQSYRNLEAIPIEAIYTFPLPLDAVLLELTLELNGETLTGQVTAKSEAEDRYEAAIEQGDSAVLLRQIEPGLYSVNLGNLLPGEQAVIHYRYSQLHHWQGDRLRFQLPTTIAPRYGDPLKSGLAPHEIPEYSLTVDHGFSLSLRLEGALARADFECPSHPIGVQQQDEARIFNLAGGAGLMDRDFVLILREPQTGSGQCHWSQDPRAKKGEHSCVALASFHPRYPGELRQRPRTFKLVLDCSGSMGGDSMAQAKTAVREILNQLTEQDRFNLTAFGSEYQLLFPRPRAASVKNLDVARRFVEHIDANLGGTEIGQALLASYRAGEIQTATGAQPENDPAAVDLLLITDGEIWNQEEIIEQAKRSGHRIFSIGVGSAVSESFVRTIAQETGGACELVSPQEQMAEHIVRQFQRIRQPRAQEVRIHWPGNAKRQQPERVATLYAGDTLHLFAWMDAAPEGEVSLGITYEGGITSEQRLSITMATDSFGQDLPRLAAQSRLAGLKPKKAQQLAVDYQLVSEYTSCALVKTRAEGEKATASPELRKVPQMLAAGWGGMGSARGFSKQSMGVVSCQSPPPAPYLDMYACCMDMDIGYDEPLSDTPLNDARSIDQLPGLPFSVLDSLKAAGIRMVQDLLDRTEQDLLALGIEAEDLELIEQALGQLGLHLKEFA